MEGRVTNPNAGDIQGTCRCNNNLKARYEASPAVPVVVTNSNNKTISNKQKEVVVVVSDSSSSSSNNNFRCTSCPRKFHCQQALAGHCKKHRGEWLSRHPNKPDDRKIIERFAITEISPISNPKPTQQLPLPKNSCSVHKDALSSTNNPIQCVQNFSISNPSNVRIGAGTSAQDPSRVAKTANVVKGPSPSHPTVNPSNVQIGARTSAPNLSHVAKTANAMKGQLPSHPNVNPSNVQIGVRTSAPDLSHVAKTANAMKGPLPSNPTVNPSNVQIGARTSAQDPSRVAKTANAVKGPSPSYPIVNPTNLQNVPPPMHSMAIPTTQPFDMFHMVNPAITLKASPTNILQGPINLSHMPNFSHTLDDISARFPFPRPTNTFQGSSGLPPKNDFPNAQNTRVGPSLIAPQQPLIEKEPPMPITEDLNHPPVNCTKAHGKSTLGVRPESMIQKPSQPRRAGQSDMIRTGSPLLGREQMMGCNISGFGNNNGRADLRSFSTAAGSNTTSRYVGGGSSNTHNLMYSRFQPGGGKRIEAQYLFPLSPHPIPHRPVSQPEHNGEDVDLDLKLY